MTNATNSACPCRIFFQTTRKLLYLLPSFISFEITGNFGQELELTYTLLLYVSLVFGQNILTPKLACQYTAEGTS